MGSREGVAAKIDVDTQKKLQEMLQQLGTTKEAVIHAILDYVYDIQPALHRNWRAELWISEFLLFGPPMRVCPSKK